MFTCIFQGYNCLLGMFPGLLIFLVSENEIVPCSLTLFTDDFDKNLNVNHPSFFMILEIKNDANKRTSN